MSDIPEFESKDLSQLYELIEKDRKLKNEQITDFNKQVSLHDKELKTDIKVLIKQNEKLNNNLKEIVSTLEEDKEELTNDNLTALSTSVNNLIEYERRNDESNVNQQTINSAILIALILILFSLIGKFVVAPIVNKITKIMFY